MRALKSANCLKVTMEIKNLSGAVYGRLQVLRLADPVRGRTAWICICSCGQTTTVLTGNLRASGGTRSCGCLHRERTSEANLVHGRSHSVEWFHWVKLKARVLEDYPDRENYFDRGIVLAAELQTFEGFYSLLGPKPLGPTRWTVGRIDNNLGYVPGNVEWQTYNSQARARRMPITNTSGIFGVALRKGRYIARWYDINGRAKSRSFSGAEAREKAIAFRAARIEELSLLSAKYHESHGTKDDRNYVTREEDHA